MAGARQTGIVTAAHRRHYDVRLDSGEWIECLQKGRARVLACGDRVDVATIAGGGAIESIAPRANLIYRSDAFREKLIAANVSQIVGVVAPDLSVDDELVHRWMIAAEVAHCRFVVAANKCDLPEFDALERRLANIAMLGYPVVVVAALRDISPLVPWLSGQHSVLIGQSGMGKSTIINALVPSAKTRTKDVSSALRAGRHTTTATTLYPLTQLGRDAWIVDSPGMKAFGLAHVDPQALERAFVDIRPFIGQCRFRDCRHDREPDCAVLAAMGRGEIQPFRLTLLRQLVRESLKLGAATAPSSRA